MQYRMITDQDKMTLLRERVTHLEVEHFRAMLISFEVEERPDLLAAQHEAMADLQQRIERHIGPAVEPATPENDAGEPDQATAGRDEDEPPATDTAPKSLNPPSDSRSGG